MQHHGNKEHATKKMHKIHRRKSVMTTVQECDNLSPDSIGGVCKVNQFLAPFRSFVPRKARADLDDYWRRLYPDKAVAI